jgi:hypothetical protein
MYLVFGQFWNQTVGSWQWQQIGGVPTNQSDASGFAYGFARNYGVCVKVVSRIGVEMYLPPIVDESQAQTWPMLEQEMIHQAH